MGIHLLRDPVVTPLESITHVIHSDLRVLGACPDGLKWFEENSFNHMPVGKILELSYPDLTQTGYVNWLWLKYIHTKYDDNNRPYGVPPVVILYDDMGRKLSRVSDVSIHKYEYDDDGGWTFATTMLTNRYDKHLMDMKTLTDLITNESSGMIEVVTKVDEGWELSRVNHTGMAYEIKRIYDNDRKLVKDHVNHRFMKK